MIRTKKEPRSTHREPGLGGIFSFMNWDKVREWIQTLGLVAIPFILGITGNAVAKSNATREVNARWVEIAAQVLAGPTNDSTKALRQWAVKLLAQYSPVPFSAPAESALATYRLLLIPYSATLALMVLPNNVTLVPNSQYDFTAVALTVFGDTAVIDLTWTASGGRITATGINGGRHYASFVAGTAPGDFIVTARSASRRLADSAFVHIRPR